MRVAAAFLLIVLCIPANARGADADRQYDSWRESQPAAPAPTKRIEQPKDGSAQNESDGAHRQTAIRGEPAATTQPKANHNGREQHDYTSAEWCLVYATVVLVVFTGGLMIYTARLWGETKTLRENADKIARQQATDTRDSIAIAKSTSNAAMDSAKAAMLTVETMGEMAQKELRAYVSLLTATLE